MTAEAPLPGSARAGRTRVGVKHLVASALFSLVPLAHGDSFFTDKVEALLQQRCYECHSHQKKIKGSLALDSRSGWVKGGDSGPAIAPGDLSHSLLIEAVRYENPDLEMPPKGKLSPAEIAILEKWVAMGAPDPRTGEAITKTKAVDLEAGRKFWAFQPVRAAHPPAVKDGSWPLDPIDSFILAKLEAASLRPVADADRYTWLRRVSLDLTGLPPSPDEIDCSNRKALANAGRVIGSTSLATPTRSAPRTASLRRTPGAIGIT
jgi:hypothetical protein